MATPAQRAGAIAGAAALAIPLIGLFEGYRPTGYADPAPGAYATICYGHREDGAIGKTYTEDQCIALLAQDAVKHGVEIDRCITREVPDEIRAAMTSFAFNAGPKAFCASSMARKLNAGDFKGACAELPRWTYAGGKQLPGLVRRRAAERALCERGLTHDT